MPGCAGTSAARSSANSTPAPSSSGCSAMPRWRFRTVVPGFGGDSPASARASTSATGSSASTAAADPGSKISATAASATSSSTLRPGSAGTSASRSSASSTPAPSSSGYSAAPRWRFRTVVPGFGGDSPAPARASTSATGSSASTADADLSSSISASATADARPLTRTGIPGFGWAPAPATSRASTSGTGSSASTTAASPGSGACSTDTARVRSACPALTGTSISRFLSDPDLPALATRTTTASLGRRSFSSSPVNSEDGHEDPSSDSESEDSSSSYKGPSDGYFIVIGDILKNVSFSEAQLKYLLDILTERLRKTGKPADTSLAKKVDKIAEIQVKQSETIDKLVNATHSEEKPKKPEWFTVTLFGRPLDLPKVGHLILKIFSGSS